MEYEILTEVKMSMLVLQLKTTLKMEAVCSSEKLLSTYKPTSVIIHKNKNESAF
jgi:hypothetical protein